ncbi:MAG: hypothetical protein ACHQKZ_13750 [Solirubrobacterales bacterium]
MGLPGPDSGVGRTLINLGIASKAEDCELVGAEHHRFNIDHENSGCDHCEVGRAGRLWKKPDEARPPGQGS